MPKLLKYIGSTLPVLLLGCLVTDAQTCCSGGVPLSGNIGFEGDEKGTLQMELSYDLNYLATLKNGSEIYADESRRRVTQSVLIKSGYQLTPWLAVDALFSYVFQDRRIVATEGVDQVQTRGLGDALLMARVVLSKIAVSGTELQLGLGPKIPLGKSDLRDQRGIALNADLQPGSGSWDAITWLYLARQLFTPSVSLRYRYALGDQINDRDLENTGGQWLYVLPALSWHLNSRTILHLIPELPVYSKVGGTQLSPTFRIQAGIYFLLGQSKTFKSS